MISPDYITTQEAAAIIEVDVSQVQRLCRTGKLVHEVIGTGQRKTYFVLRTSAEAYRDTAFPRGWKRKAERPKKSGGSESEPPPGSEQEGGKLGIKSAQDSDGLHDGHVV